MPAALFDPPPKRRRFRPSEPHALVPLDPHQCPRCGAPTRDEVSRIDALFRHGGFGATMRHVRRWCDVCWWALDVETAEERPPR